MATLTGPIRTWRVGGNERRFGEVTLPYHEAVELAMPVRYNAVTGAGEQRDINEPHMRKIKKAMLTGEYTPVPSAVGLRESHRKNLIIDGETFFLTVDRDDPLPLTDGGHRQEALTDILKTLRSKLPSVKDPQIRARIEEEMEAVRTSPITFTISIDGDPQRDFINLQAGRPVDTSHVFSLQVKHQIFDDPAYGVAMEIAHLLNDNSDSPFYRFIRFDSREAKGKLAVTTLCAKSPSDQSTSLVGLAQVGMAAGKDAKWLARAVVVAYTAIKKAAPSLFEEKKVITPSYWGTKGSNTMLVGLGICIAHRAIVLGKKVEELTNSLVAVARETLDELTGKNFPTTRKRTLMGKFARMFFDGDQVEMHDEIPVSLLKILSASTYAAEPLPKVTKPPKTKKGKGRGKKVAEDPVTTLVTEVKEAVERGDTEAAYEASEKLQEEYDGDADDVPLEDDDLVAASADVDFKPGWLNIDPARA